MEIIKEECIYVSHINQFKLSENKYIVEQEYASCNENYI